MENCLKTPKGTRDWSPAQMQLRERIFATITQVFKRHGCKTIDTPVFEMRETLRNKYGEDSKLIYDLADQGGELLSLRYDLTVPFARYLASNRLTSMKRYHIGKVYRRDNPALTRGRYREFYQCDVDIAGSYDAMVADAEVLNVIVQCLSKLQVGDFQIKINHRLLLDAIIANAGVSSDKFRPVCSSLDKLDKMAWKDVAAELVELRGLTNEAVAQIGRSVANETTLEQLKQELEGESAAKAISELELLMQYCKWYGIADKIVFSPSLARGLDYYTGPIFEAVLLNAGDNSVGSIGGGGRYDQLVGQLVGNPTLQVPCVGASIGVERIFLILEQQQQNQAPRSDTQIYVASAEKGMLAQRVAMATRLRNDGGFNVEFSYTNDAKLLKQLQFCEANAIAWMVIVGSAELADGKVTLRHVPTRQEIKVEGDKIVEILKEKLA